MFCIANLDLWSKNSISMFRMRLLIKNVHTTTRAHSATCIFLHGSGDTGPNLSEWVRFLLGRDMEFPHIKIIYPTAPAQPYTPLGGEVSNVWFDRRAIAIDALENRKSLSQIYGHIQELIVNEIDLGIPANRILIGGFSMGGALALHTAYHLNTELAGVFACSSFLNRDSIVYDSLRNPKDTNLSLPELRMYHGEKDELVPSEWGKETFDQLIELGVEGEYIPLSNTLHELKKREILDVEQWIQKKLPQQNADIQHKL